MAAKATIMIVDDDMTLHEMYSERLKEEGYTIGSAYDGEEALSKVYDIKPDLILLDVMMPKMNGIDVMKKLREDDKTKNIPIILLTALVQEISKIKDMMGPSDGYMIKSEVTPAQIVESIKKIIG
jgi:two-component system, sensor histidine kinase and response regulator